MSHPSYSYLDPGVLELALDLARQLRSASQQVSELAHGVAYSYSGGGRTGDKNVAVKDWVGPHHDTFQQLFGNEMESMSETTVGLGQEADAWAQFWATATDARNARLYDEAMDRHDASMSAYRQQVDAYQQAVEDDPDNPPPYYPSYPPTPPVKKPPVAVPTFGGNYQPTG